MRRRKILHLQLKPILSGPQWISRRILDSLPEEQWERWIACAPPETEGADGLLCWAKDRGINTVILPSLRHPIGWRDLPAFLEMLALFRSERFDIIHTHSTKTGILGRVAARLAGCRCIIHTVHGIAYHQYQPNWRRMLFRLAEFPADWCGTNLTLVNRYYARFYRHLPAKRVHVIYNGIEMDQTISRQNRQDGKTKILWAARMDPQKDPLGFIRAVSILAKKRRDFSVTMAGNGEYYPAVERLVQHEILTDVVQLVGWRSDVRSLMADHDILCSSSLWEAFGLTLVEAGAAGLPVVATRVEGVPEVVADGVTGCLVPPADPESMAATLERLLDDPASRQVMGEKAKEFVTANFDANRMNREYRELYERCR